MRSTLRTLVLGLGAVLGMSAIANGHASPGEAPPCFACINYVQAQDGNGDPIPFTIQVSNCSPCTPVDNVWYFDYDPTGEIGDVLTHTFVGAGTHAISVTFHNDQGEGMSATREFDFGNDGMVDPVATDCTPCLTIAQALDGSNQPIPWSISTTDCSTGGEGPITSSVDFGDLIVGPANNTHAYAGAPPNGHYDVCITMDAIGCNASRCYEVYFDANGILLTGPYTVYVFGNITTCSPDLIGQEVTIATMDGTLPEQTLTTTIGVDCSYYLPVLVTSAHGSFEVTGPCGNSTVTHTGDYTLTPPFSTDLNINLTCAPTTYQVTVSGHVSPCALLDNTVTVRVPDSPYWNGVQVPVDGNCDYTYTFTLSSPTGEVTAVAGCSNGLVPYQHADYTVNSGNTAEVTLDLSCEPLPCHACMNVTQPADGGGTPIPFTISAINCSTGGISPISWLWDCGDGFTGNSDGIYHTYDAAGTYTLCMTYTTGDGCTDDTCVTVTYDDAGNIVPPVTEECHACITLAQALDNGGQPIPFQIVVTGCSTGGDPWAHHLEFGDGNWNDQTGGGMGPIGHIYSGAGTYSVCYTYTSIAGCSDDTCLVAVFDADGNLGNSNPVDCEACFTVMQTTPFSAVFHSDCSTSGPGTTYIWDFSDGGAVPGAAVDHTYLAPGTYAVCLNLADGTGCTSQICHQVVVSDDGTVSILNPDPCEAGFWVIQAYEGDPGNSTHGDPIPNELWAWNLSHGGSGLFQFVWDFGDGETSTEPFPTHHYDTSGPYQLCLTITDSENCTDTYCESVEVDENGLLRDGSGTDSQGFTIRIMEPIVAGVEEMPLSDLSTWPNPVADELNVSLGTGRAGTAQVQVLDLSGRQVMDLGRTLVVGKNRFTVSTDGLNAGLYLLRVAQGERLTTVRFVKAR